MLIRKILSGKTNQISKTALLKQKYATAMAWQIINLYPKMNGDKNWDKYKNINGVLLADEVGGGKTFEALTIISKSFIDYLNKDKRNFRVLIIANPAIRSKWEWREEKNCDLQKFNEQISINNKNITDQLTGLLKNQIKIKSKTGWKKLEKTLSTKCIVITSVNALPPTQGKKVNAEFKKQFKFPTDKFDWIIADEAHIVKSGYLQTDENISAVSGSAVRRLYATLNACPKAKILLLTATPFHNNVMELRQMISLLDHKSEDGVISIIMDGLDQLNKKFIELKENVNTIAEFSKRLKEIYNATNHDINLYNNNHDKDKIYRRPKRLRMNGQRDGLDDFLRDVMVRNRKEKLNENIKLALLNEKEKLNYLLMRDLIMTRDEEAKKMISIQLCQLVSNPISFYESLSNNSKSKNKSVRLNIYKVIRGYFGADLLYKRKFETLLKTVRSIPVTDKKVITIFCRFINAIEILERDFKSNKYKVITLHGKIKVEDRTKVLDDLRMMNQESNKKIIFLVSQVGNEGLDFDEFSNTIIHFDGHYNPAVISQRNGRVYRRGNKAANIRVENIILSETYDQRIKFIEEEKKKMKDFYLGDSDLASIYDKIFKESPKKKKEMFSKLRNFRIDLEPKLKYLLPSLKKEI